MLGKGMVAEPVCMANAAWKCSTMSVCSDRMMQSSSTMAPRLGKSSLTISPLFPWGVNRKGEGRRGTWATPRRLNPSTIFPLSRCRAGLGSKVSTWEKPPVRNTLMRWRALGAKCGAAGATGRRSLANDSRNEPAVARAANPIFRRSILPKRMGSIQVKEIVGGEKNAAEGGPGGFLILLP